MRLRRFHILLLFTWAVLVGISTTSARADSPARPFSYTKTSADGRFLFVMIPGSTVEEETRHWIDEKSAKIRAIRSAYAQSGLYRNDGSRVPLWTVDWYAFDVDVASDGVHLVRHGPWASRTDQEAFSFFANGKLVRTYAIAELVDFEFLLPHSVSHFEWSAGGWLDDAAMRYAVSTKDGSAFVFDVANGATIQETRYARALLVVGVAAIVACVGRARLRRKQSAGTPAAT